MTCEVCGAPAEYVCEMYDMPLAYFCAADGREHETICEGRLRPIEPGEEEK